MWVFVLKTWQDLLRTGKYLSLSGKRYIFITKKKCFSPSANGSKLPFVYIFYQVNPCKASIIEQSGSFYLASNAHNHAAEVGATLAASITAKVKPKAAVDIFRPASAIVEEVLLEDLKDVPCLCFPKREYIAWVANRHQQHLRPQDPTDLNFDVEEDHIPDRFLRGDIQVRLRRHLMFATDQQLQHLAWAKS